MPRIYVAGEDTGLIQSTYLPDEPLSGEGQWFDYLLTLRKEINETIEVKSENNFIRNVNLARSFAKFVQDVESERSASSVS